MSEPVAYLQGRWLPAREASLPLLDAGFVWGATVTDRCRTFRGQLFRLDDHLTRFQQSCQAARIPQPTPHESLRELAVQLVQRNHALLSPAEELSLVLFATPGTSGVPTLGMYTTPLPIERHRSMYREGARLLIPAVRHVPASSVDPRIKQRSRLFWWLAEAEVHEVDPLASALLLDHEGYLTETAIANVLLVRDGAVCSPRRSRILNGISLQATQELCEQLAIPFVEADLTLADLSTTSEALLTNSSFCVAPVKRIGQTSFPCSGPVFESLLSAWSELVRVDLRG